jgi:hypothetical protein
MARHPRPDFGRAFALEDPAERVRAVLTDLYGWYRETEPMMGKLFSDRASVSELDEFMRQNADRGRAALADSLTTGFDVRSARARRLRALLAVALDFGTWMRLNEEGFEDAEAADLMCQAVAAQVGLDRATK